MNILVKQSKPSDEFLIYLMHENIPVECYMAKDEESKRDQVNQLLVTHFVGDNWNNNVSDFVTEMSYNDFKNQC